MIKQRGLFKNNPFTFCEVIAKYLVCCITINKHLYGKYIQDIEDLKALKL